MKLYINTTSPFVRLVRLAIAEKGLAGRVETETVDPWGDAEPFLRANAAARVPTLVTDDGTPIAEALLILRYLDAIAPEPSVWPARDLERTLTVAAVALGAIEAAKRLEQLEWPLGDGAHAQLKRADLNLISTRIAPRRSTEVG